MFAVSFTGAKCTPLQRDPVQNVENATKKTTKTEQIPKKCRPAPPPPPPPPHPRPVCEMCSFRGTWSNWGSSTSGFPSLTSSSLASRALGSKVSTAPLRYTAASASGRACSWARGRWKPRKRRSRCPKWWSFGFPVKKKIQKPGNDKIKVPQKRGPPFGGKHKRLLWHPLSDHGSGRFEAFPKGWRWSSKTLQSSISMSLIFGNRAKWEKGTCMRGSFTHFRKGRRALCLGSVGNQKPFCPNNRNLEPLSDCPPSCS